MSIKTTINKLFAGDPLRKYQKRVEEINAEEERVAAHSLEELKAHSQELKKKVDAGTPLDDVLVPAFALVRETAKRLLNQRPFDVQLVGAMVLHDGRVAEMLTGEGKTLAAVASVYLNALAGKGVHVVTVNDYLAKRDTVWMGQLYAALGLSVGCVTNYESFLYDASYTSDAEALDRERDTTGSFKVVEEFLRPAARKDAYRADITYGTNHAFGFDYLRDNLTLRLEERVQRGHRYVVIDEVDSILIDEARTPLIISAPDAESSKHYQTFARVVRRLTEGTDYEVDEKQRIVSVTDAGIDRVQQALNVKNLFAPENAELVHYLDESLKAKALFREDRDYVVKDGEVIIVDQFTGRLLPGRRYSEGLHQAIEAKEQNLGKRVRVQEENKTYAEISVQNYFRLYEKISGMTGTAQTSAEEFESVYGLEVVSVPPNQPVVREDRDDLIYKTEDGKYQAIVKEVKARHEAGQPILLGTASIEHNETISRHLKHAGVPHEVLNAKNNEREGAIIAQAGKIGAVTVATNMAGRGVDIVLGGNPASEEGKEKVKSLGGLYVVGTERHEARRIDNQLRGRSGRQGDPGASRFFLSLEDDLMRIFGGDRIKALMQSFNIPEDVPIESKLVSKAVNHAQHRVEGMNLDVRKHLLEYDDVLERQRNAVYADRLKYLEAGEQNAVAPLVKELVPEAPDTLTDELSVRLGAHLTRILDFLWIEHLEALHALRESVGIRAYAQHEPVVEYRKEAYERYQELKKRFREIAAQTIPRILGMEGRERAA